MFKKSKAIEPTSTAAPSGTATAMKFLKPKILLVDLEREVEVALTKEGYNVATGTFGKPYKVAKDSSYQPIIIKADLPNHTEQEVVIVDLMPKEIAPQADGERAAPLGELDWWAKCSAGMIDPRPRVMAMVQEHFDRILETGGVFIVFADSRDKQEIVWARGSEYHGLSIKSNLPYDNWSFLSVLANLTVTHDHGEEISPSKETAPLLRLLSDHLNNASFSCTVDAEWQLEKRWLALAQNKYGASVAGVIAPPEKTKSGWVFVLPRIKDKGSFLAGLLKNILPDLAPTLFPHSEGQRWVHRSEYELSSVLEKARTISSIQDEAARKVVELEKAIETDRNANKFLYDLLRETGTPLVEAIKTALALLGLASVVDVDDEMREAGRDASLREDLRIHDISPVLVVDIKGVAGKPADGEALQAQKHAFIYIQEQNRADVRGLTIINHQRLLPPLDRDNDMPFRKEILDNAEQVKLGLMTAWDLFRLVRGFIQNRWMPEQVIPLFYQTGRILPIPQHYEYVGKVKQVWKPAYSVEIETGEIRVGDRVAVEFPVDFDEQPVASLRLNDSAVQMATAKCEAGISRKESLPKVKTGMAVY